MVLVIKERKGELLSPPRLKWERRSLSLMIHERKSRLMLRHSSKPRKTEKRRLRRCS